MVGELLERCTNSKAMPKKGEDNEELGEQSDLVRVLPHDVLADVFRRLAPRWLAASRCVCRDWRATIDARRLLRADLLPISVCGIFLHFYYLRFPELFARPSSCTITGCLDFLPNTHSSIKLSNLTVRNYDIKDHCNGLLLLNQYVVNPATRRWDPLPRCPPPPAPGDGIFNWYLAFDPTVSPHYEVFVIPHLYCTGFMDDFDPMVEETRLASPSTCVIRVFSSRSASWEQRSFVREGGSAGAFRKRRPLDSRQCAVYWRGALYVLRDANFVVRMSLSNNRYSVISPPVGVRQSIHPTRYLGRSHKGVYFAAIDSYRLQVWILDESSGQMEWMPKLDKDLEPVLSHPRSSMMKAIVEEKFQGTNSDGDHLYNKSYTENKKSIVKGKLESSFHNRCAIDKTGDSDQEWYVPQEPLIYNPKVRILGFHPHKEVVFLSQVVRSEAVEKALVYHLSTSEIQWLGNISPTNRISTCLSFCTEQSIKYSFSYTPCWLGEIPRNS